MRHGMAGDVEPAAAAVGVAPALEMHALRIVAKEQVFTPGNIACVETRAADVRGPTTAEFTLIARTAIGATKLHHRVTLLASVGNAGRGCLIDQAARDEALELEGLRQLVVASGGEYVGKH